MTYTIEINEKAKADIAHHKKSGNLSLYRKLESLFEELHEHPYTGTGKPERLKENLSGLWSRRINQEHRLIYSVEENIVTVTIVSAKGHYQ
jgi:toxin YoeB